MHKGRITELFRGMDRHRALLMFLGAYLFLSLFAPHFFTFYNTTSLLKASSLNGIVAIGFTLIFILGELDLSVGAVVMLCGMLVPGLQPELGWAGGILCALLAGACIGLVNGLLVAKAGISSFIVTLGMMVILEGVMHIYSGGSSMSVASFGLADWLDRPLLPLLPPRVIITFALVGGASLFLQKTPLGRGFFIVGGDPEMAWRAGLNRDRYLILGFVICSVTAALGGALLAASLSSMTGDAVLATRTLMTVLAAVIIGGTPLTGGKGSVVKSYFAVLLLTTVSNGIGCFGLGFEVQMFANGVILAAVVLYEAYVIYRHNLLKGQRPHLLADLEQEQESNSRGSR